MELEQIIAREYHELAEQLIKEQGTEDVLNPPISTGFAVLDELLDGGFKKGELIILSAPTKQGKTTLAQTISWNMAQNEKRSLWLTMELSWQELTRKFMAMDEQMKSSGRPSWSPIFYPIDYYRSGGNLQMEWLKQVIMEAKEKQLVDMVIIDHLHFLLPLKDFNTNVSFLIGAIVREVKKIAVELKIPIILIAHTKKMDVDKRPDINSLRDSSFIAQESDFTLIMWRHRSDVEKKRITDDELESVYTNKAFLSLEANRRNGKTGKLALWHDGSKFVKYNPKIHNLKECIDIGLALQKKQTQEMMDAL